MEEVAAAPGVQADALTPEVDRNGQEDEEVTNVGETAADVLIRIVR